jgi:hypothetical protein
MMTSIVHVEGDRRVQPRIRSARACKIFDPRTGRYHAGSTRNLSRSGALLQVDRVLSLSPGDHIYLGVAHKRRDDLLLRDEMVEAEVTRASLTVDDHTAVAVRVCCGDLGAVVGQPSRGRRHAA